MNKTYDELLKYYSNATKEQAIEDMLVDNNRIYDGFLATQEELTDYAKENERLHSIINDLYNGLEKIIEQGYDYNEKDKIAVELISKLDKEKE